MRKYIEPELICRVFAAENIVTSSGGQTEPTAAPQSSVDIVTNQITSNNGVSSSNVMNGTWE